MQIKKGGPNCLRNDDVNARWVLWSHELDTINLHFFMAREVSMTSGPNIKRPKEGQ